LPPGTSGSLRKGTHGTEIAFSGKRVLEVLALLNEPLGIFEGWKPKLRSVRHLPDSVFVEEAKKYAYKQEWKKEIRFDVRGELREIAE